MWMDLKTIIQSEVRQKERNKYHISKMEQFYLQNRNKDTDVENKHGHQGGKGEEPRGLGDWD